MKLPEGVSIDVNYYATNEKGLTIRCVLKGLPVVPKFKLNVDTLALMKSCGNFGLPPEDGPWRPMTREEIKEFIKNEGGE